VRSALSFLIVLLLSLTASGTGQAQESCANLQNQLQTLRSSGGAGSSWETFIYQRMQQLGCFGGQQYQPNVNRCPNGATCRLDQTCCGNWCCGQGQYCSHYGCTPVGAVECGGWYCNPGSKCSYMHNKCLPADRVDCGSYNCEPGYYCGSHNSCLREGSVDCGNGASCEAGHKCSRDGKHCLSLDAVDCGSYNCNAEYKCGSGNTCLPRDYVDCGGGKSCPAGHLCIRDGAECLTRAEIAERQEAERRRKAEEIAERKREAEERAAAERLRIEQEREAASLKEEVRREEAQRKKEEAERLRAERKIQEDAARLAAQRKKEEEIARHKQEEEERREAQRKRVEEERAVARAKEEQARLEQQRKKEEAERRESEQKRLAGEARLAAIKQREQEAARLEAELQSKRQGINWVKPARGVDSARFWTGRRMRHAVPLPLPRVEAGTIRLTPRAAPAAPVQTYTFGPENIDQRDRSLPEFLNKPPLQWAGKFFFSNESGQDAVCSAQFIAPRVLLTAAHCVRNFGTGAYYSNFAFALQYHNGDFSQRYTRWNCLATPEDWVKKGGEEEEHWRWDYALLLAVNDSGTGHFGWQADWQGYDNANRIGYPGGISSGEIIQMEQGPITLYQELVEMQSGNANFRKGSSGGAWISHYEATDAKNANLVISVQSFERSDTPGVVYGPYLDANFKRLFEYVSSGCP